ncbi:MAG: hypothetical protein U5M51_02450 [Emticicia sp.]|nr:hypothetical protein [Emticicia sp.]
MTSAEYNSVLNAVEALRLANRTTNPEVANKAIYYISKADAFATTRGHSNRLQLGKSFEFNMNDLFLLPNTKQQNIDLLHNVSTATGVSESTLRNASYYRQVQIEPRDLPGKRTVPDDLIVWEVPDGTGGTKNVGIVIDSKYSENAPETVNQSGFITLGEFNRQNNYPNSGKIKSSVVDRTKRKYCIKYK